MKTNIISGNFAATIDGELNEDATINVGSEEKPEMVSVGDVIREAGLTYIVQRDGLSTVYKSLLKKGEKRNTVEFSPEASGQFESALTKALAPYGDFAVSVAEHVPSEGGASPMLRATALVDGAFEQGEAGETLLRSTIKMLGGEKINAEEADTADREGLIKLANQLGMGIQPPKAKKAATA